MDKKEIRKHLELNHYRFTNKLDGLSAVDFERIPGNKWTAGQQLDHILKSVNPTAKIYNTDLTVLHEKYGLSNRVSRSYDQLVSDYLAVLDTLKDFVLPERFIPTKIAFAERSGHFENLHNAINDLVHGLQNFEETHLDTYLVKHPAMGKLTLREMLYFTIYHVTHHDKQILENLENYPK